MKLIFNVKNKLENCTINVILEQIYLILFSILLIYQFFFTTMFSIEWPVIIQTYLRTIIILLLVLKTAVDEKTSISEFIIMFALGLIFLLSWKNNGGDEIFLCLLSIWGARNIDFKKILKVFFGVILFLLIFTMISALTGNVENLVFYQEGRRPRMAFGICYPTDFSAYVFYLAVIYCYFRKEKLKYIETGIIALAGILVYYFCDARLNTICLLLTAALFSYLIFMRKRCSKHNKTYKMHSILKYLFALSPTLCGIVMVGLSILYSPYNSIFVRLNNLLNNRLYYSNKGIDIFGMSLWGQYIPMRGNGGTTEAVSNYFFLDSSYIYILLQYGILILLTILVCWFLITFKAARQNDIEMLFAVALIAVQCIVEHHMLSIVYNPFLMAVLAKRVIQEDDISR